MRMELIYYRMWDKRIHAIHVEKAEFNIRVGLEVKEDLLSAINIEANNKAFLNELDTNIFKGFDYCRIWLSGLLADYVKRRSRENNDSPYLLEFYTNWLCNSIFITNVKYPAIKEWCEVYKKWIIQYYEAEKLNNELTTSIPTFPQLEPTECFRNIIQYEDKDKLLFRLHQLIDGRKGADVGAVLLNARINNYITRNPTKKEFKSEFQLMGSWSAITNYMSDNRANALDRANKIVIFS